MHIRPCLPSASPGHAYPVPHRPRLPSDTSGQPLTQCTISHEDYPVHHQAHLTQGTSGHAYPVHHRTLHSAPFRGHAYPVHHQARYLVHLRPCLPSAPSGHVTQCTIQAMLTQCTIRPRLPRCTIRHIITQAPSGMLTQCTIRPRLPSASSDCLPVHPQASNQCTIRPRLPSAPSGPLYQCTIRPRLPVHNQPCLPRAPSVMAYTGTIRAMLTQAPSGHDYQWHNQAMAYPVNNQARLYPVNHQAMINQCTIRPCLPMLIKHAYPVATSGHAYPVHN